MKLNLKKLMWLILLPALLVGACSDEKYVGLRVPMSPSYNMVDKESQPIYKRHKDTPLKILAIGNSFTNCAIHYLPPLINKLEGDSVCIAKLVKSSASLSMHWNSHISNSADYDLYYSDGGTYKETDIKSIDEALTILDWDIIVVQQVSGLSGIYSSYEPYIHYLLDLFRESNPGVLTAWQCTWAYMPGTIHSDFFRYEYDSERMYAAIIGACSRVSSYVDIVIPSAVAIRRLREAFPEVEDGFTVDGYHLDLTGLAGITLSSLWHECLIAPYTGVSSTDRRQYFNSGKIENSDTDKALDIVADIMRSK